MSDVLTGMAVWLRVTVTSDGATPVVLTSPVVFRMEKPNGSGTIDRTAALGHNGSGSGLLGQAEYQTTTSDLNRLGTWNLEVRAGAGPAVISRAVPFRVVASLPAP